MNQHIVFTLHIKGECLGEDLEDVAKSFRMLIMENKTLHISNLSVFDTAREGQSGIGGANEGGWSIEDVGFRSELSKLGSVASLCRFMLRL